MTRGRGGQSRKVTGRTRGSWAGPSRACAALDEAVRAGIPKPALDRLVGILASSLDTGGAGRTAAEEPDRAAANYQRVERFNLQVSETTERIARLYAMMLARPSGIPTPRPAS